MGQINFKANKNKHGKDKGLPADTLGQRVHCVCFDYRVLKHILPQWKIWKAVLRQSPPIEMPELYLPIKGVCKREKGTHDWDPNQPVLRIPQGESPQWFPPEEQTKNRGYKHHKLH